MRRAWLAAVLGCAPVAQEPVAPVVPVAAAAVPEDRSEGVAAVPEDRSEGVVAVSEDRSAAVGAPVPGDRPPVAGEASSVKPGINAPYQGAGAARRWAKRFERDGREVHDRRAEIIKKMGLTRGAAIADVGAGTGLFTVAFAEAVGPEGAVYAVDVTPGFLAHVRARADKAGLRQVRTVLATDRSCELAPGSVDAIFMSDAYHHLEYPQHTLATLRAALRAGGTLWLIDFIREDDSPAWIKQHVRAGKAEVLRELAAAGFVLVEEVEMLRENYFLKLKVG